MATTKKSDFVRWTNKIDKFTSRLPKATKFYSVFRAVCECVFFCCCVPATMPVEYKQSGDFATTQIIDAKMNTKLLLPFHNWYTNANLYEPISLGCVCVWLCASHMAIDAKHICKSERATRSAIVILPFAIFFFRFCKSRIKVYLSCELRQQLLYKKDSVFRLGVERARHPFFSQYAAPIGGITLAHALSAITCTSLPVCKLQNWKCDKRCCERKYGLCCSCGVSFFLFIHSMELGEMHINHNHI